MAWTMSRIVVVGIKDGYILLKCIALLKEKRLSKQSYKKYNV